MGRQKTQLAQLVAQGPRAHQRAWRLPRPRRTLCLLSQTAPFEPGTLADHFRRATENIGTSTADHGAHGAHSGPPVLTGYPRLRLSPYPCLHP